MPVLRQAATGQDSPAREHLLQLIETRVDTMARYFGRRYGVDADDLRQEAWLAVLEMLPRLDLRVGAPEQHLLKRARWRILDSVRHYRRRACMGLSELHPDLVAPSAGPENICTLTLLLARLTDVQRQILHGLLEGRTWREVGAQIGCTSANVAYHVRRIRAAYVALEGGD